MTPAYTEIPDNKQTPTESTDEISVALYQGGAAQQSIQVQVQIQAPTSNLADRIDKNLEKILGASSAIGGGLGAAGAIITTTQIVSPYSIKDILLALICGGGGGVAAGAFIVALILCAMKMKENCCPATSPRP